MLRPGIPVLLVLAAATAPAQDAPARPHRRPQPSEYGRVVMATHSQAARLAPVVFDHWLHRARYTCRACHVVVGFAMTAGGTGIRAADNAAGQFCGACHNGRTRTSEGNIVFEACVAAPQAETRTACLRCHSAGKGVRPQADFATATRGLPRERFGNGIDWEKAELQGLIKPADFVEGVSIRRPPLQAQADFALSARLEGMPNILFSHVKHTVWNGCELCHPEIFAVQRGAGKISMVQIFEGRYCGACHTQVAFPLTDCQRCHTQPVRMTQER